MSETFLDSLPDPHPDWRSTGAVFRLDDPRDFHLEFLPQVAAALPNLPLSLMLVEPGGIPYVMDQNGKGACTVFSICTAKMIEDFSDIAVWNKYDGFQMYADLGGTGNNGISADPALRYTRDLGCRRIDDGRRFKIGSYMFAPRNRNDWRNTLAAALASTGPCVVAMLLPSSFSWESSGSPTSGYHQMCLTGYTGLGDDDYAVFLNSWSVNLGNRGFYRVKWGYLEDGGSFQSNYVYGYQMIDVKDWVAPDPIPLPMPFNFAATVLKAHSGKILIGPIPTDLPNLVGRRVQISNGQLQSPGRIAWNEAEVMMIKKGDFSRFGFGEQVSVVTID